MQTVRANRWPRRLLWLPFRTAVVNEPRSLRDYASLLPIPVCGAVGFLAWALFEEGLPSSSFEWTSLFGITVAVTLILLLLYVFLANVVLGGVVGLADHHFDRFEVFWIRAGQPVLIQYVLLLGAVVAVAAALGWVNLKRPMTALPRLALLPLGIMLAAYWYRRFLRSKP